MKMLPFQAPELIVPTFAASAAPAVEAMIAAAALLAAAIWVPLRSLGILGGLFDPAAFTLPVVGFTLGRSVLVGLAAVVVIPILPWRRTRLGPFLAGRHDWIILNVELAV